MLEKRFLQSVCGLCLFFLLSFTVIAFFALMEVSGRKNDRSSSFEHFRDLNEEFDSKNRLVNSEYSSKDIVVGLSSNFGVNEYVCSGNCYCGISNDNDRRSAMKKTGKYYRKGLLYLVSAVSSIIAFKSAERYFHDECVLRIDSDCLESENRIYSEVEFCETVSGDEGIRTLKSRMNMKEEVEEEDPFTLEDDRFSNSDYKSEDDDPTEETVYKCTGRCESFDSDDTDERVVLDERIQKLNKLLFLSDSAEVNIRNYDEFFACDKHAHANLALFCHSLELTTDVSVERKGIPFHLQEERAMDYFTHIHLNKFCKSNSLLSDEMYKEKFYVERPKSEPRLEEYWDLINQVRSEMLSETRPYCRGSRTFFLQRTEPQGGEEEIIDGFQFKNVVCLRQFTQEEWERGVANKKENLRHWKDGYKVKPDVLTREKIETAVDNMQKEARFQFTLSQLRTKDTETVTN